MKNVTGKVLTEIRVRSLTDWLMPQSDYDCGPLRTQGQSQGAVGSSPLLPCGSRISTSFLFESKAENPES